MGLFKKTVPVVETATDQQSTKIILVCGAENGLIPFQIAHYLRNHEKDSEILLIDNSTTQDLYKAVPREGNIGNAYEISVVSNRQVTMDAFKKFNYVIVYLGYIPVDSQEGHNTLEYFDVADFVLLVSDFTLQSRDYMRHFDTHNLPLRLLFINKVTTRVSEKMLIDVMEDTILPSGTDVISLEFTEDDASGYIQFLYDGIRPLNKMSKEYQAAIATIAQDITKPDASLNTQQVESEEQE